MLSLWAAYRVLDYFGRQPAVHRYDCLIDAQAALDALARLVETGGRYFLRHAETGRELIFRRTTTGLVLELPSVIARDDLSVALGALGAGLQPMLMPAASGDGMVTGIKISGAPSELAGTAVSLASAVIRAWGLDPETAFRGHFGEGDSYNWVAYLAEVEPTYARLAEQGPSWQRAFYRRHLSTLRRAARSDGGASDPAA